MTDTPSSVGSPGTPAPDIVIAKFSIIAFWLQLLVAMAMFVGFWSAALNPSGFTDQAIFENRIWLIIALLFTSVMLWAEGVILQQMIFHGRRAVWIENGRLMIIDSRRVRPRSLAIADIGELSIGSFLPNPLMFGPSFPVSRSRRKTG